MPEFCEYMGVFGGVCMEPQAEPQAPDACGLLLHYCAAHLALAQRHRERSQRPRSVFSNPAHDVRPRGQLPHQHLHGVRGQCGPYLSRATSREPIQEDQRVVVLDSEDEGESNALSSRDAATVGAQGRDRQRAAVPPSSRQKAHNEPAAKTVAAPVPTPVRRKRVRVKKIVVPPRFEVLDGEPSTPPKVWYVRLDDRVPGEAGDPDDDEFIEVDEPDAPLPPPTSSAYSTSAPRRAGVV